MSADIGMGKSQRYQAAVDGHEAALHHWIISEKMQGMKASRAGIRADPFDPGGSWGCLLAGVVMFNPPVSGGFFFWRKVNEEKPKSKSVYGADHFGDCGSGYLCCSSTGGTTGEYVWQRI